MTKFLRLLPLLALSLLSHQALAQTYGSAQGQITTPSQMSLNGTFKFAGLPSAATYVGYTAYTSDQGPVYSNGAAWVPIVSATQNITCTNGATGAADVTLLQAAATAGGPISLLTNCTINAPITIASNTILNGNGHTITAAAAANWSGGTVAGAITGATNATQLTVENTNFVWPNGSGGVHILNFISTNSQIGVLNNTSTGAGDFSACIGCTDIAEIGNHVYNSSNSCYDHWNGAGTVQVIGNFCSMYTGASVNYAILWTGFNTDNSAAINTSFKAIGNTILLNSTTDSGNNVGIWLQGNNTCGSTADDYDNVADNHIILAAGVFGVGVRATGCVNNATIHDNVIVQDGVTVSTHGAIESISPATNVSIHDNIVKGWNATGAIFRNNGTGGTLQFNHCYGTCVFTTTLDTVGTNTTIQQIGDDNGTGQILLNGNTLRQPYALYTWGIPAGQPPSGYFQNNGLYIVGQLPASSATLSLSATSGSVTATFSAATLLGTASDVTRVITICDGACTTTTASTYKYCTITAQSSTTVATCTVSGGTLSGTGPFANSSVWISGAQSGTASYGSVLLSAYNPIYLYFPVNVISAATPLGLYYSQCVSTTVCTVFNNPVTSGPPVQVTSPTAFAVTGTGAFSQSTGSIAILALTIPANSMGANGSIDYNLPVIRPNDANTVQVATNWGGTAASILSMGANYWGTLYRTIRNNGQTNVQTMINSGGSALTDLVLSTSIPTTRNIDTTANVTLQAVCNLGVATDYCIFMGGRVIEQYAP